MFTGRNWRTLAVLTAVVLLVSLYLIGCSSKPSTVPTEQQNVGTDKPNGDKPVQQTPDKPRKEPNDDLKANFRAASISWEDEKGNLVWEAEFKEAVASRMDDEANVELRDVEAKLYSDGKVASTLTAPRVDADSRTREVRAYGGVRIKSVGDDASANVDRLVWKSAEDKVVGTGGVHMVRANISITARSMETDTGLEKARFTDAKLSLE